MRGTVPGGTRLTAGAKTLATRPARRLRRRERAVALGWLAACVPGRRSHRQSPAEATAGAEAARTSVTGQAACPGSLPAGMGARHPELYRRPTT